MLVNDLPGGIGSTGEHGRAAAASACLDAVDDATPQVSVQANGNIVRLDNPTMVVDRVRLVTYGSEVLLQDSLDSPLAHVTPVITEPVDGVVVYHPKRPDQVMSGRRRGVLVKRRSGIEHTGIVEPRNGREERTTCQPK